MSNILGSLFVELRADTAAFVDGMSKASYSARRAGEDVERSLGRLGGTAERALEPFGPLGVTIAASFEKIAQTAGKTVEKLSDLGSLFSKAGSEAEKAAGKFGKFAEGLGAVGGLAGIAAGAAASVAVGAVALAAKTSEASEKMLEQARAAGVSVESLSGLSFAAKQAGVDQETLVHGLEFLSAKMLKASESPSGTKTPFTRMKLDIHDLNGELKDAGQFYVELLDKLNKMPDRTAAVGFAKQTLGKGGAANLAIGDADEIQKWAFLQKELGAQVTTELAVASEKFNQSMRVIGEAGSGVTLMLQKQLLPALDVVATHLASAFADSASSLNDFITLIAGAAKTGFAVGETYYAVFEQISKGFGLAVNEAVNFAVVMGSATKKWLSGDFSGSEDALKDGLGLAKSQLSQFAADSKKIWADNDSFNRDLWKPLELGKEKKPSGRDGDTGAEDKGKADAIQRVVDKYEEETASHLRLAEAAKISTAAIKEQAASDLASQVLTKLRDEIAGRADLIAKLKEQEGAVRAIISASKITGDVASVGAELQKDTDTNARHVDSLEALGRAYQEGGSAIAAAKIEQQLEPEKQKLAEISAEIEKLDPKTKDYAATLERLRGVLIAYNAELEKHRQQLTDQQQLTAAGKVTQQSTEWTKQLPLLEALNASYFKNAEAVRQAQNALELYNETQKLKTEGASDDDVAAAGRLFAEQKEKERRAQIAQQSQQYNPNYAYDTELEKLQEIRAALEAHQASTMSIDTAVYDLKIKHILDLQKAVYDSQTAEIAGAAAIYDENRSEIAQWDDKVEKVGTFSERIRAMLNQVELEGDGLGQKIFGSFTKAIDDVSSQLAKLVVTGKSNFRELFQSLEQEVLKATFQKGISTILGQVFGGPETSADGSRRDLPLAAPAGRTGAGGSVLGAIGSIFGLKNGPGKADGSSANPFYVIPAGGLALGAGGAGKSSPFDILPGSIPKEGAGDSGSGLAPLFSTITKSIESVFSGIGGAAGGIGKLFSGFAGIFGGFLAGGGDVSPGRAYIVGENHPEFFMPKQPGTVATSIQFASAAPQNTEYHFHIQGVTDADSFRRSQGQIFGDTARALTLAHERNR